MSRAFAQAHGEGWLFSKAIDLGVFVGPTLVSLLILAAALPDGVAHGEAPQWMWLGGVLMVDVAHVWGTGFRVYADRAECRRRPWLYALTPMACFAGGLWAYAVDAMLFWRVLAYIAVWHFIRQQMGWMALYRRREGDARAVSRILDNVAILAATGGPLLFWHTHLPSAFCWMMPGDFFEGLRLSPEVMWASYIAVLGLYSGYAVWRYVTRSAAWGRNIIVATTAINWLVGIVLVRSDFAFTLTNVLAHGVPYMALIYVYGQSRLHAEPKRKLWRIFSGGPYAMLGALWAAAFLEEMCWDHFVWHEQPNVFGQGWLGVLPHGLIVPLLAVPQLTHYVLDGFVWQGTRNEGVRDMLRRFASSG